MKHINEYSEFKKSLTEAKGGQIMPGDYVKSQYGDIYLRVDGKVGGADAYVRVIKGKAGKRKTGLHHSVKLTLVNKDGLEESVTEGTYNSKNHIGSTSDGQGSNAEIYKKGKGYYVVVSGEADYDFDAKNDKELLKKLKDNEFDSTDILEVNEATDMNDPVLMAFRATRRELPKFKPAKAKSRRLSFDKYMDLLDDQRYVEQELRDLTEEMAQTLRDMEQEAEPEGGKIADKYGSIMMKQEKEYAKLKAKKAKIDARLEKHRMD